MFAYFYTYVKHYFNESGLIAVPLQRLQITPSADARTFVAEFLCNNQYSLSHCSVLPAAKATMMLQCSLLALMLPRHCHGCCCYHVVVAMKSISVRIFMMFFYHRLSCWVIISRFFHKYNSHSHSSADAKCFQALYSTVQANSSFCC